MRARLSGSLAALSLVAFFSGPTLGGSAMAAPSHPFSVQDMLAMQRVGDPQVSPDGKLVAFSVRTTDMEANRGRHDLWLARTDGKEVRRLTTHPATDVSARWTVDGRSLLFLSSRSGSMQVWRIAVGGGEAEQITDLPLDVGDLVVSPDGEHIAVSMEVFTDCEGLACTKKRLDEQASRKASGMLFDRLFIRHWNEWEDGRRKHLFVIRLADPGAEPLDVMKGMDADSPSKPWGGTEEVTFTPDGQALVFSACDAGRQEAWSTNYNLFVGAIDGSGTRLNLTKDNPAWDTAPTFSPDGKTLAWLAMARPGYESDRMRVKLMAWPVGKIRTLTPTWDRSPSELVWAPDGRSLYATATNLGQHSVFSIDAHDGEVKTLIEEGTNRSVQPYARGIILSRDSLAGPVELWSADRRGHKLRQLTHINDARVAAARTGEYEQFTFEGAGGDTVHGYLVKPVDFDPAKRYPVAFLIHGGPQGSFGNHFHYRWNPQAYAGAGYAAVMIDFHGSTGYGQAFTDSIRGDWGGKPYEDLMRGLDHALATYSFLDGKRVGALGASFGGYMIYWIAGQTDRFRCLISHDGNIDERFAYFDTEELWFPEWDHEGTPWTNPEGYRKFNPVEHIQNWKTPMLVIHGQQDFRVAVTQGFGAFNALQRLGVPSQLLYFPDEDHWVQKPANSAQWHETVIGWLDRWTK